MASNRPSKDPEKNPDSNPDRNPARSPSKDFAREIAKEIADGLADHISHLRMSALTSIGRSMLPPGYWGASTMPSLGTMLGAKSTPTLYLTFDDGPNPSTTPHLIDVLGEEEVSATFFLIGSHAEKHKQLAHSIFRAGHEIGNHTYTHGFLPSMSVNRIVSEIKNTNNILAEVCGGKAPTLFRPPYGIIDKRGAECIRNGGLSIVYWSAVPEDWTAVGANRVVERVARRFSNGAIIVLHEQTSIAHQTLTAARDIIRRAKSEGYEFSTISI
jgi:peptidoglycan/xylan/chitin deacetylase (PgdA/CDA1 family)